MELEQLRAHVKSLPKQMVAFFAFKYIQVFLPVHKNSSVFFSAVLAHPRTRRMILAAIVISRFARIISQRITYANDNDPITMDPITSSSIKVFVYHRGSSRYRCYAESLAKYISMTGCTRDPFANIEFSELELARLDAATAFRYMLCPNQRCGGLEKVKKRETDRYDAVAALQSSFDEITEHLCHELAREPGRTSRCSEILSELAGLCKLGLTMGENMTKRVEAVTVRVRDGTGDKLLQQHVLRHLSVFASWKPEQERLSSPSRIIRFLM